LEKEIFDNVPDVDSLITSSNPRRLYIPTTFNFGVAGDG
jgi:hypothetical protein